MGIFDMLGAGSSTGADNPPATPPAGGDNPPATPPATPPAGTENPPATPPATPPAPGTVTAPVNNDDPLNIAAMLAQQNPQQNPPPPQGQEAHQQFAQQLIASVLSGSGQPDQTLSSAPQVQAEVFAKAMENADFTSGIDLAALETALQSGENVQDVLKGAFQATAANAVFAMVPLINQMAAAVQDSSVQQAMQQGTQASRSDQIVSTFNQSYPYAANPIVSEMVNAFAVTLAQKAPPSATPEDLAKAVHQMLSGMSGSIVGDNKTEAPKPGITEDFSNLFGTPKQA